MKILVINSGSSSIKYQLFDMSSESVLARGLVERIDSRGAGLKHYPAGKEPYCMEQEIKDHRMAIKLIFQALTNPEHGILQNAGQIDAIGHRVVHGGEVFHQPVLVDADVKENIRMLAALAPLHNPANLLGIKACEKLIPEIKQVAVFDTAYHHTIPPSAYMYAIPYGYYEKYGIRKYGFHGTSHQYVAQRAAALLNRPLQGLKIISCHLGNGSSITAIRDGCSIDTSMGLTPLEGVAMGTRSGDLDPAIVTYLMERDGLSPAEVTEILNYQSGMLGVSGVSNDFRDLEKAVLEGNHRARLSIEIFVHRVKKYIGAYAADLNGVDVLVFTAGVGENSPQIRADICEGLDYLRIQIDPVKNRVRGREADISAAGSPGRVMVIPTNEELMIALETLKIVQNL